jgi:maltooligosyltrehalose trehalohydrolase
LPRVLNETFLLSGGYSQFRGRRWGGPAQGLPGDRFVIGIQNHDHIGNRALGERLSALVSPAVNRLCASLMLLSPHLPFLFMGEEYGERNPFQFFCDFSDGRLIEAVRTGRRRDYELTGELPDPQAEGTFTASRLTWAWPAGSPQAGLRQLYRDLLSARKKWPALRDWASRQARLISLGENSLVLQLIRGGTSPDAENALLCYFNLTNSPQPLEIPNHLTLLFSSEAAAYHGAVEQAQRPAAHLLPFECAVFGLGRARLSPS